MIFSRLLPVLVFSSLVGRSLEKISCLSSSLMASKERRDFLASVEAEEDWLDQVSRRLSLPAVGSATEQKDPPPTSVRTPRPARPQNKPPASAGPITRASRKRRLSPQPRLAENMSDQPPPPEKKSSRDDQALLDKLEQMISGVRGDIAKSEANTAARIDAKLDDLSSSLSTRLSGAEATLSSFGGEMSRMKGDLMAMRNKVDTQARSLSSVVENIVERKLAARPGVKPGTSPRAISAQPAPPAIAANNNFENKYWQARRSLRIWPIPGPDLVASTMTFLHEKLRLPRGKVNPSDMEVVGVSSTSASEIVDQAIVTFGSVRLRDEVKSAARNLAGTDRKTGLQLEAPDHLRSHYQVFQKLGYQIKNKHPALRRNVKFDDIERSLVMDIKISADSDWKTILYNDAKLLLKRSKDNNVQMRKDELDSLVNLASPKSNNDNNNKRDEIMISDSDDDDYSDAVVVPEDDKNIPSNLSSRFISFMNANARSLTPKIESLCDCLVEKGADLAFVTETWFQDHRDSYQELREYSDRFALGIINRNRTSCATNLRQYGGVAILFRLKTTRLEQFFLINPNEHEVVAAHGKITGIKGKVFCVACYAPPNLTREKADDLLNYLSDVISEGKRKFDNCTVIVCGDFNQWPAESLLDEHPDLFEVDHGPTRRGRAIDRSFVNFGRSIIESGTLSPLETEQGVQSDHKVAWAKAEFKTERPEKATYTYRKYTEKGAADFLAELATVSWRKVYESKSTTAKVKAFQSILDAMMDRHFELKTTTRALNDPPWFNDSVKKQIKKRRKVYDRQGRSKKWKAMKAKTDEICRKLCGSYLERQKNILTAPDAARSFYRNVKSYNSKEKPPAFDVKTLYPGEPDLTIAEKLAEHFNAISNEFEGLREGDMPERAPNSLAILSRDDVVKRLLAFKKPKSMVKGDIFPALVNRASADLANPLLHIYNTITLTQSWPDTWKIEYVTPIPKKTLPQGAGDLRNISCTQLFSKIYESFVLEWLGQQVKLRLNQFGGVKGSGTEHFLVQLWQQVLENIEDPRAGSLLTSIDFAKAFNRLDFSHVIKCLKVKGADTNLVRIVASFLSGRVMTVKVGTELSAPRQVLGGVPQGSLLGVFLFNLAIDDFEACNPDVEDYSPSPDYPVVLPAGGGPVNEPVAPEPTARDARHTFPFKSLPIQVSKYVDDCVQNEKVNFDTVLIDGAEVKDKLAVRSSNLFRKISFAAGSIGMVVHSGKTQILCIAETKNYVSRAHFFDMEGNRIESQSSMKILGFVFSSDPDMGAQVEEIKRKFRARIWTLRHLGHVGFSKADLLKVYRSVILPVHDYCSCVFNSSLTITQSQALERLQAQSLKAIYGYEHSYRALLEMTGLTTLQERRDKRDLKFAQKCSQNDRYKSWFPLNPIARCTRQPLVYQEKRARTQRLYKSPLFNLRRRLNGKPRMS